MKQVYCHVWLLVFGKVRPVKKSADTRWAWRRFASVCRYRISPVFHIIPGCLSGSDRDAFTLPTEWVCADFLWTLTRDARNQNKWKRRCST
ncbi:hypothetical protein Y032_0560g3472 [Ancylostoma ceylanicum]|uniref:Uncharacterized protein n=1 Tax=Ancylostoma ceylanicum TaxID=53326 RepID=A0A016WQ11_9BILA|nr:hypothetical protein Y032_0560g3472 [Ancylostoma ceylanicum]